MSTINDIITNTRTKFCPSIYHNYGGLNVLTDELAEVQDTSNIFALFVQSTSSTPIVNGRSISEEYTLSVAFCKLMPFDNYDAEQVESEYIAPCKDMAQMWLSWLIANYPRLRILATTANREYLKYDAVLCGYSLTMKIREYNVNYACLSNPTPIPQYQRILNKMPTALRNALLVWYCPKLQGLTNEQLAENSGYYEGGLHDLSGNGYDADIYGMSGQEGDGFVNEQGELVFDGIDDYAQSSLLPALADFTLYCNAFNEAPSSTGAMLYKALRYNSNYSLHLFGIRTFSPAVGTFGSFVANTSLDSIQLPYILMPSIVIGQNGVSAEVQRGTMEQDTEGYLWFSRYQNDMYKKLHLYNILLFTRTLTDTEITWLQSNMINI